MNTRSLSQLYDELTPSERLPLIMAAATRGDETEKQRLMAAAPEISFRVRNYHPLAQAHSDVANYHVLTLLDLAAQFWLWWGLDISHLARDANNPSRSRRQKAEDSLQDLRTRCIARYFASRFVAYIDAWKQFCTEVNIDPQVQLEVMIGWQIIQETEPTARELAFSPEEAERFVRLETVPVEGNEALERGPAPVEKFEDIARGWHQLLEHLVAQHGGP